MLAADIFVVIPGQVPDEVWSNRYGAGGSYTVSSITQTSDGGYIIAGDAGGNAFLVKTDAAGNMQWNTTIAVNNSIALCAGDTSDGGYMMIGSTDQGLLIVKTNPNGVPEWNKTAGDSEIICIRQTSDNGYALCGYTGITNVYASLAKVNATGDLQWQKTYKGLSQATSVQETPDGGYLMIGEGLLIRLDQNGNALWNKTYQSGGYVYMWSIQNTSGGGYIIAGTTSMSNGGDHFCLIKTDSETNLVWRRNLPDFIGSFECFTLQTSGGYVIAGVYGGPDLYLYQYFWAAKVAGQVSTAKSDLLIGLSASIPLAALASIIVCFKEYRSTKKRNKIELASSDHP
jgi:hypothetical protein